MSENVNAKVNPDQKNEEFSEQTEESEEKRRKKEELTEDELDNISGGLKRPSSDNSSSNFL